MSDKPGIIVPKRDALGWGCFLIHIGFVIFIVTGWAVRPLLIVYLVFVPAMVLHWHLNRGTCVLNNLESLIRTGRWRNPANLEEGAWLRTVIYEVTGLNLAASHVDLLSYGLIAVLWGLGLWHRLGR